MTAHQHDYLDTVNQSHAPESERLLTHDDHLVDITLTSWTDLGKETSRHNAIGEVVIDSSENETNHNDEEAGVVEGVAVAHQRATLADPNQCQGPELQKARVAASGTACCILGCLIAGPIGAILAGFGTAYAAENKEGPVGDVARAVGDVALSAYDKAREVEDKHHVVDCSKQAALDAWEKAKQMDRDHHICERTKDVVVSGSKRAIDFANRNRLLERGIEGVGRSMEYVGEKITSDAPTAPETEAAVQGPKQC